MNETMPTRLHDADSTPRRRLDSTSERTNGPTPPGPSPTRSLFEGRQVKLLLFVMAEVVAGAISLCFPVIVYSLPAENKSNKFSLLEDKPDNSRSFDNQNTYSPVREWLEAAQKHVSAFSNEVASDASETAYRKRLGTVNRQDSGASRLEPAWFRNVVERSPSKTREYSQTDTSVEYSLPTTDNR